MQGQEFFRYRDENGRVVIVDSLDRVPPEARARAERLTFSAPSTPSIERPPLPGVDEPMHWQSFAAGFVSAVLIGVVLMALRRFRSPFVRVVLLAAGVALAAGAYLGWLRRTTGQSGDALGSPSAVIDDARKAVDSMNRRNEKQKQELDEILRTR